VEGVGERPSARPSVRRKGEVAGMWRRGRVVAVGREGIGLGGRERGRRGLRDGDGSLGGAHTRTRLLSTLHLLGDSVIEALGRLLFSSLNIGLGTGLGSLEVIAWEDRTGREGENISLMGEGIVA